MPYNITTRDGITINDIPDEMPPDHPDLKARVAQIRAQGAAGAPPAASRAPSDSTVTAPTSGVAMGLRDAVDAGAQMLRRVVPDGVGTAVDNIGNKLHDMGLPVARSSGVQGVDAIVQGVNDKYEAGRGPDAGYDWGRLGGNILQPANYLGGGSLSAASGARALAVAGAKAGAVAGALQPVTGEGQNDFWTSKAEQAGAGAAGGAVATPLVSKVMEPLAKGVGALAQRATPAPGADTIRVQVTNILRNEGIDASTAPKELLDAVGNQVQAALSTGGKLDPAAIMRKAQFEAVGLTGDAAPTLGQATRDPMQFAQEKNLSGVRIKTPQGEGNPLADRFQLQNNQLRGVFDQVGANQATDRVTAGQAMMDALRGADAPVKQGVDDAYAAARAMTGGRSAELDIGHFAQTANKALDDGMWGAFVPSDVQQMLNKVAGAKASPLTVDVAEQLDTRLAAAQRRYPQKSPERSAIGVIRDALHGTPILEGDAAAAAGADASRAAQAGADAARTVDDLGAPIVDVPFKETLRTPGLTGPAQASREGAVSFNIPQPQPRTAVDEGAAAREAFQQARAAARERFATIESTPALKAALDQEAPDKFVQNYVLNANVGDVQALRKVLENSPEALAQARAQVAEHLKNAAFGVNASGDKAFTADRYLQTLRALGPQKLGVFFSPAEMVRLNLAGKVASDINSIPAGARYATNTSGTGAALMNLLSKVAESPLLRKVPGARMVANQVGEIRTERLIDRALSAAPAQQPRELSPEAMRAIQRLFAPAGVAGGVLAGSVVN